MTLYMAVTDDEYELPLAVCDLPSALARKLGVNTNTVAKELCYDRKGNRHCNGKRRGYILKEVEVNDDE